MREKSFSVFFSPAAVRDVDRLEAAAAIQLIRDIKTYLELRPIPIGKSRVKKIAGFNPPLYRIRSGDFRAYYRIRGQEVIILAVTARKDSEKRLKRVAEDRRRGYSGRSKTGLP
jgi:mRNA-degrading endonuclease RelE of RelBE toxin-antitoxin system